MVFSSLVFLFYFLPSVLLLYFLAPKKLKNFILLIASLFFYAWGEPIYIFLMIFSIFINYFLGLFLHHYRNRSIGKKMVLTIAIIANIFILGYFKYSAFFIENINQWFSLDLPYKELPLPIGISFFTFQAMSYIIDVYRNDAKVQKNLFNLALYISLFPQLVAGPIVRYNTIAEQIQSRTVNFEIFSDGVRQFIIGLSKKVLVANPLGEIADTIFAMEPQNMSVTTAWIGIIAYTFQIYFDFSGYSDMAIGLGKMFGFTFLPNFKYPYISQSIGEFWRRWHISLSSWFRDYVYIPLGGNRKGPWKTYRNLLIVWTITGFWHGASWTFMVWGLYYGVLISIERIGLKKVLDKMWRPIRHFYVLLLVMVGWVFFRADHFPYSFEFIQTMFGLNSTSFIDYTAMFYMHDKLYLFIIATIFSLPVYPSVIRKLESMQQKRKIGPLVTFFRFGLGPILYISLLMIVTMFLVNSTYNPFIYFRF